MCNLCRIKPVYEFTNKRKVCKNCYIKWFNKKTLYAIRKFSMIKKGDVIKLNKKTDFRNSVLRYILKNYAEKYYAKIVFNEKNKKKKYTKIALSDTTDLLAKKIINEVVYGDIKKLSKLYPVYKKEIRPFYLFLDKEVLLYANLMRINYSKKSLNSDKNFKNKKHKINEFIDNLEKKHPEIKRAIVNNFIEIFKA